MNKLFYAWDLGATKCHAGLIEFDCDTQKLTCLKTCNVKLAKATSLENLIFQVETKLQCRMADADAICIGAAGQFDGEMLNLEGVYPFAMPFAHIAAQQKWPRYAVIHDYSPIVCATFTDYMDDSNNVLKLNDALINPSGRRVAFGIGTGLGGKDGVLFDDGNFWLGKNELGHIGITYPPADTIFLQRHIELMRFLSRSEQHHPISFEKILSGPGLVRLYQFFHQHDSYISPEDVGLRIAQGKAPEVMNAFAWYLGLFVGALQLIFMPEGGVWITGGVSINHLDVFKHPDFFAGIETSPAYLNQRQTYALGVLRNLEHGLIGCGYYAAKKLITNGHKHTVTILS